jgi:hypothetical protein
MSNSSGIAKLRTVLLFGGITFGLSALALLIAPELFAQLLALHTSNELSWSLRMIAITLVALTGNMLVTSRIGTDQAVVWASRVMLVIAFALGLLTLLIPAQYTWFTIVYALVGFGFSFSYAVFLLQNARGK